MTQKRSNRIHSSPRPEKKRKLNQKQPSNSQKSLWIYSKKTFDDVFGILPFLGKILHIPSIKPVDPPPGFLWTNFSTKPENLTIYHFKIKTNRNYNKTEFYEKTILKNNSNDRGNYLKGNLFEFDGFFVISILENIQNVQYWWDSIPAKKSFFWSC